MPAENRNYDYFKFRKTDATVAQSIPSSPGPNLNDGLQSYSAKTNSPPSTNILCSNMNEQLNGAPVDNSNYNSFEMRKRMDATVARPAYNNAYIINGVDVITSHPHLSMCRIIFFACFDPNLFMLPTVTLSLRNRMSDS